MVAVGSLAPWDRSLWQGAVRPCQVISEYSEVKLRNGHGFS